MAAYELRIRPTRGWAAVDWLGLWECRDLLSQLIRRDYVSKYSQTILGPLWFVIQPILTTITLSIVFGKVAKIPTDGVPPILFYLCGMLSWNYFASTFTLTSSTFVSNAALFGKVYFPRLIVPISVVISNLITVAIQLAVLLLFLVYYKYILHWRGPDLIRWQMLLLPLVFAHVGAVSLGVGLWISALTARYRDLVHVSGFMLGLWFYVTPVIYPLSVMPVEWHWVAFLNPLAFSEEFSRYVLLGKGASSLGFALLSIAETAVILVTGVLMFQRCERSFVDTV